MKKISLVLGLLLIVSLLIIPSVSAIGTTLGGNITQSGAWISDNYQTYFVYGNQGSYTPRNLTIVNIELTSGTKALIHYDPVGTYITHDVGAPHGAATHLNLWYGTQLVASGTVGYQRLWDAAWPIPNEIAGYQYYQFDTWNITGLSGTKKLYMDYNHNAVFNFSYGATAYGIGASVGIRDNDYSSYGYIDTDAQNEQSIYGNWTFNRDYPFKNMWNATNQSGLGITGYVTKILDGNPYPSRVWIVDGYTLVPYTSQGLVTTDPFYFNVPASTIRICCKDSNGVWFNTSQLFPNAITPTPTPTPIVAGDYSLSVNTPYVNVTGTNIASITSTLDPSLTDLTALYFMYKDTANPGGLPFYEVGSTVHQTMYEKIGGTWEGYDSADVDYNNAKAGVPSPITLKWDTTAGAKTLWAHYRTSGGQEGDLYQTVTVGSGNENLIDTKFQAMDGLNGGQLQMVSMQIYDHNKGQWTNSSPNTGLGHILSSPNTIFSVYVQKPGFTDGQLLNVIARASPTYEINLYSGAAKPPGYVSYYVTVQGVNGLYIGGALIQMRNTVSGATISGSSSTNGGALNFNLTNSTLYTWSVSKSGYQTQSGSFTTPASGSGNLLVTLPVIVTPTKTTVIPTGSWTVNPSNTPAGGGGNTTFWQGWINVFTQMGANNSELPLLLAGIVIISCMAAGAGMAGVLGAEVAMGFGAVFCVAVGFIPIWVVIAIIALGFLFYGLKIGR